MANGKKKKAEVVITSIDDYIARESKNIKPISGVMYDGRLFETERDAVAEIKKYAANRMLSNLHVPDHRGQLQYANTGNVSNHGVEHIIANPAACEMLFKFYSR